MCMGGGKPAKITVPSSGAYDQVAQLQMDAMRQQQDGIALVKQAELNQALRRQEQVLTELSNYKAQKANETSANAQRLAALIGAPPPNPSAKAPVVGPDREGLQKNKGKRSLRIELANQQAAISQTAGAGLNITTAS